MKLKLINVRRNNSQLGFSLLETMAAAMLSILFVSMGANLVLTANIYKVASKKSDMMNSLIRSDVESIKYQASRLEEDNTKCINSASTLGSGYAWALKEKLKAKTAPAVVAAPATTAPATTPAHDIKTTNFKILGNTYTMTRTIDLNNTDKDTKVDELPGIDPDILPITYTFVPQNATSETPEEYNLTVQIIPNASLKCK